MVTELAQKEFDFLIIAKQKLSAWQENIKSDNLAKAKAKFLRLAYRYLAFR